MACAVIACETDTAGRRLCAKHWRRQWRHGTTDAPQPKTPEERFWAKVDRRGPHECWPWTGSRNRKGYGNFYPERTRPIGATHAALLYGAGVSVPVGLLVRHKCDNPPCVNPAHLELGTVKDNARDMVERGRLRIGRRYRGEANAQAKLDEAAVRAIRASGEGDAALALMFGVSRSAVRFARIGRTWRHLACRDRAGANETPGTAPGSAGEGPITGGTTFPGSHQGGGE